MNYEYKITHLLTEREINDLSKEGWELVQVVAEMPKMYFKRLTLADIHDNPERLITEDKCSDCDYLNGCHLLKA